MFIALASVAVAQSVNEHSPGMEAVQRGDMIEIQWSADFIDIDPACPPMVFVAVGDGQAADVSGLPWVANHDRVAIGPRGRLQTRLSLELRATLPPWLDLVGRTLTTTAYPWQLDGTPIGATRSTVVAGRP